MNHSPPKLRTAARIVALVCMALTVGCAQSAASAPQGWERHAARNDYAIEQVGPNRLRFEVRGGDKWDRDVNPVNRAELKGPTRYVPGQDVWFSYQVRVRAGPPDTASWCVIGQFHHTKDPWDAGSSPPFAVELVPGSERLLFRKRYTPERATTVTFTKAMYQSPPIQRDRWMHIVGHIVFGWNNNGTVEIWLDGRKVVDLPRTDIGYNDVLGPYWKFGIYRAQAPEPLVVEYANMEIGSASLLGRVGHPLPIR